MSTTHNYCEFHRHGEDIVYQYDRVQRDNRVVVYVRRDKPLWMVFKPDTGWVVVGDDPDLILSWPIDCPPDVQADYPPPGVWESQKGEKSFIYTLSYPREASSST